MGVDTRVEMYDGSHLMPIKAREDGKGWYLVDPTTLPLPTPVDFEHGARIGADARMSYQFGDPSKDRDFIMFVFRGRAVGKPMEFPSDLQPVIRSMEVEGFKIHASEPESKEEQ